MPETEIARPEPAALAADRGLSAASRWLFDEPDFRRLWLVGVVVFAVRWLEMLAVAVFAYQHTGSPFIVASLTMLRMLPMALFGALVGAVADRIERRAALIVVVLSMLLTSLTLVLLASAGELAVWHLAVASFVNGIAWTTDNPVRRTMIGEVVGSGRMGKAMSIDVGANNASRILGPTVGGVLLATVGIGGAFAVSVLCYLVALAAAFRVRHRNSVRPSGATGVLTRMIEGLVIVRHDRRLVGTLVITVIYNTFGWPFTSMIPVIGQDNLQLGAVGIGILASMDGVGAFCGAVAIALWARPLLYTRLYVGGVLSYLIMLPLFALSPYPLHRWCRAAGDRARQCRVQHHAGDPRLSVGAGRDAQPHLRRAVGLHRHRYGRLHPYRPARRPDRGALGDRGDRRRGTAGDGADAALLARHGRRCVTAPVGTEGCAEIVAVRTIAVVL